MQPASTPNGESAPQTNGDTTAYVIDALLDLALRVHAPSLFDARYAACECIEAYFDSHSGIRQHFLRRAIDGFSSGEDETSNVLTILMAGPKGYQWQDPYRIWFASVLAMRLLFDDTETKKVLEEVTEGDASEGEEVVSCIQVVTGNLIGAIQDGEDERVAIGYLMLLCVWMFEDDEAVNDLLSEGSTFQSLVQTASKRTQNLDISQGLCTILLGTLYEFSTKDSPIPRRKLQPLLVNGIGREFYAQKIKKLRENPYIRDFEVLPQDSSSAPIGELPEVYFENLFVDFVKDNFSRFSKAIDRDPGLEVARLHQGVDRDLVDSLRSQIEDKSDA